MPPRRKSGSRPPAKRRSTSPDRHNAELATADVSDLETAIEFLGNVCKVGVKPSLEVRQKLKLAVELVEAAASETGLNEEDIETLVDIAAGTKLSKVFNHRLIRSLVPCAKVPHAAVTKAVSWIGTNLPPVDTQALLIRWIVVVYDFIDNLDTLHCLYGLLFLLIENLTLRPHVCSLLHRLTRVPSVRMYRVRALLALNQSTGPQPAVLGLLSVYKLYCPHLVAISVPGSMRTFFRLLDRVWAAKVMHVVNAQQGVPRTAMLVPQQPSGGIGTAPVPGATSGQTTIKAQPPAKKSKVALVPPVGVVNFDGFSGNRTGKDWRSRSAVPLSQIRDFADFVSSIDCVEPVVALLSQLPSQMAAVLTDTRLQHLLACSRDPVLRLRLGYWLERTLEAEFGLAPPTPGINESRQAELLQLLVNLSEFLQEGIPEVEQFLVSHLTLWNGRTHREQILLLVTRWRLCSFTKLNEELLEPMRELFLTLSYFFKAQVLICYTALLRNIAQVEWPRHRHSIVRQAATDTEHLPDFRSVFAEDYEDFSALDTVARLVAHVDSLCVTALLLDPGNVIVASCALDFFDLAAHLHSRYALPLLCAPSRQFVQLCLIHRSAAVVSRLCTLVCRYRTGYSALKQGGQEGQGGVAYSEEEEAAKKLSIKECVGVLNVCLVEMCDYLWKNKPNLDPPLELPHANSSFSLYMHRALLPYAHQFLQETQPKDRPFHPMAIKECKDVYLQFLSDQNLLTGFSEFIVTYVRRDAPGGSDRMRNSSLVPFSSLGTLPSGGSASQ